MTTTTAETDAPPVPVPPDNANDECVGPTSTTAGTASSCEGCPNQSSCAAGAYNTTTPEAIAKAQQEQERLSQSLRNVSHVILILSGKGGVGKSTMATQLALTLSHQQYAVGLLDVDLCGPSVPQMIFGKSVAHQQTIHQNSNGFWIPVYTPQTNLAVMSINFLLPTNHKDQAVIWRGPRKNALIQQFITQVDWTTGDGGGGGGGLDYLIIDTPPGTSDEHISTVQYIQQAISSSSSVSVSSVATTTTTTTLGAIVITTPEEASLADVRKELSFCQKTNVPVYGMIENMATLEVSNMNQLRFVNTTSGMDCTNHILQLLRDKCPELLTNQYTITSDLFAIPRRQQRQQSRSGTSHDDATTETTTTTTECSGVVQEMARTYACPYWGTVPLDRTLLQCCEHGSSSSRRNNSDGTTTTTTTTINTTISDTTDTNDNNGVGCFAMQYPNHTAAKAILQFCQKIVHICPVEMDMS